MNHYKILPKYNYELIPLSNKKHIYSVKEKKNWFIKVMEYNNTNLSKIKNEIDIQKIASNYNLSPKIIDHINSNNNVFIIMEKIDGYMIYDLYGDNHKDIPNNIWIDIRNVILQLYKIGIEYVDISPYNFMYDNNNKLHVVDFGHARKINWFLIDFLDGLNEWNPDYK